MKKLLLSLSLIASLSSDVMALPLVSESSSLGTEAGLMLFPDHEDPNKFYFFPGGSKMVKDSTDLPVFGFTHWGLTNGGNIKDAGGYMSFTTQLAPTKDQQDAINQFLEKNPKAGIAMLPVKESAIGIQTTNETGVPLGLLFEEWNFSKYGGQGDAEIGVNAVLTGVGAKALRKAIKNPGLLNVNYCYKYEGLGPDFDAIIHMKWKRIYDHYRASFSASYWFSKVSITKEVEKLRQNNMVKIEINGGDAKDEEYVQAVAEKIIKRLFVEELQARPGNYESNSGWKFASFTYGSTRREELKEEKWFLKRRRLVERNNCVAVSLKDVRRHYRKLVQDAEED